MNDGVEYRDCEQRRAPRLTLEVCILLDVETEGEEGALRSQINGLGSEWMMVPPDEKRHAGRRVGIRGNV